MRAELNFLSSSDADPHFKIFHVACRPQLRAMEPAKLFALAARMSGCRR
ncbi:hypothetical protein [Bradyrhizobium sp. SZCCHNR1047]|nr:hypothetical protein [Bradyrhizobium sp. SZCCHNR1047]